MRRLNKASVLLLLCLLVAPVSWGSKVTATQQPEHPETPFYSTMNFKFDGDRLMIDAEHNVSFGQTKLPQLIGQVRASE